MIYDRTKYTEMTESYLHWLVFCWSNVSAVGFYSISVLCVTFSVYLCTVFLNAAFVKVGRDAAILLPDGGR